MIEWFKRKLFIVYEGGMVMKKIKRIIATLAGLCLAGSMLTGLANPVSAVDWDDGYDINFDGEFDLLDIVSLSKWIHQDGRHWLRMELCDLNQDNQVDIFDLALLKQKLLKHGIDPEVIEVVYTAKQLSAGYVGADVDALPKEELDQKMLIGQTKFAIDLLRNTVNKEEMQGKNVLVSPYSVSQALGMTANGAKGDTLSEMEAMLGGSMDTLNHSFYTFRTSAPDTKDAKLSTANSIWMRDGFSVRDEFLQTNADYYGADAFNAPFDASTVKDINGWVNQKTDQMIPSILYKIDASNMMYLINAVAFDAKWQNPYEEYQVSDSKFTAADGTEQDVKMMSEEIHRYLKDDHAIGFMKYYKSHYAFAALLPEEGMTPEQYLADLTPERLQKTLTEPVGYSGGVYTALPQFKYAFSDFLND